MSTEELKKELEKLKDFKVYVFEGDVYVKAEDYREKAIENKNLEEENELLKNELAWMKAHTRYNGITKEEYIDGTMTATEAKLRLQQAEANQNYVSNLEERIRFLEQCLDNKEKVNISLRKDIKWYEKEEDRLREENNKLKLHIEAKDKAYTALLKDYEELKEDRKKRLDEIDTEIERFKDFRKSLEK